MIVGIIGSGGREHAICKKIKESPKSSQIFCIPGNAGTNSIAQNVDIKINDFKSIKEFCLKRKIELFTLNDPISENHTKNGLSYSCPIGLSYSCPILVL